MRARHRLSAVLAVGIFGLLAMHAPQELQAREVPYEINVILALTGPAAFIGKAEQQSLQFIEGITNRAGGIKGRPVKFVIADDQSNPQVSVQLANQLIAKGVPVILGPTFTSTCLAVSAIVAKSGPVEYCFSPSVTPPAGGFAYSASVSTHDDAIAILRFFREHGWTHIALMTTTDASGQQFEQYFDEALTRPDNKAVRAVAREHFNPSDLSVTAQAERIKAASPQAMIGWTAGTATGTLLRGLHDAGVAIPIVAGNGNMIHAQLQQYEGFLPSQLYFAGRRALVPDPSASASIRRAQQAYFRAFKSLNLKPNIANSLSWDASMIVVDAFREKGLGANATQINDYIQHLNRWTGINGTYDFRAVSQRGVGIDGVVMDQWVPATKRLCRCQQARRGHLEVLNGKIGLEEHFALEQTLGDSEKFVGPATWIELRRRLLDIPHRLEQMDALGIETLILSLNAPAVQATLEPKQAAEMARIANALLAEEIAKHPGRFAGFAALPMQDPDAAAIELERCVREYGFVGALVNGYSQIGDSETCVYYDAPQYRPLWALFERLDVPFYLHPREPSERRAYAGHAWLVGPAYGFGAETGLHALRLAGSGLFDAFPKLTIILGHLGEGLPFNLHRIDERIRWSPLGYPAKKQISEYFAENFYITTAGNFRTQALINCILELGADRILFSTDYPFEELTEAATWFDAAGISERDRQKIGRDNAQALFRLPAGETHGS